MTFLLGLLKEEDRLFSRRLLLPSLQSKDHRWITTELWRRNVLKQNEPTQIDIA
jgi:hypothetical protein